MMYLNVQTDGLLSAKTQQVYIIIRCSGLFSSVTEFDNMHLA